MPDGLMPTAAAAATVRHQLPLAPPSFQPTPKCTCIIPVNCSAFPAVVRHFPSLRHRFRARTSSPRPFDAVSTCVRPSSSLPSSTRAPPIRIRYSARLHVQTVTRRTGLRFRRDHRETGNLRGKSLAC